MKNLKRNVVTDREIEDAILLKFFRMHAAVSRHIYESDVPKGMPPDIRKRVMYSLKKLRREGLVVESPHGKEHVFKLNIKRIDDIKQRIKRRNGIP